MADAQASSDNLDPRTESILTRASEQIRDGQISEFQFRSRYVVDDAAVGDGQTEVEPVGIGANK